MAVGRESQRDKSLCKTRFMATNEEQLSSAIREIPFKHWDPIGFGEHPPNDEYDRYIPPLVELVYSRRPR